MQRGLIIKKEWLDRILDDGKEWEMRSAPTRIRGLIYLIEAGSGLIVGEAHLRDCGEPIRDEREALATKKFHHIEDTYLLKKWRYPWKLWGAIRYDAPIPYKHPHGAVIWVNLNFNSL